MPKKIESYCMSKFQGISITGKNCALKCKHCNHHYLNSMIPATTTEKLLEICKNLDKRGANGILLSGGCNENGELDFKRFFKSIERIKNETNLTINAHTGLISKEDALNLGNVGVDVASVDVVGNNDTIKEVYGINKTTKNYEKTLRALSDCKIPSIVPHICVGLHFGEIKGEFKAFEMIKRNLSNPSKIVLLIFIPTKGTEMEKIETVNPSDFSKIVKSAKKMFNVPIQLGCMRPRNREYEISAIKAGIDGIANPSKNIIKWSKDNNYEIKNNDVCCAV